MKKKQARVPRSKDNKTRQGSSAVEDNLHHMARHNAHIELRRFHNSIKQHLIMKYATEKVVFDIGSGKGGDIFKFVRANAKYVLGIDNDLAHLEEAQQRLNATNCRSTSIRYKMDEDFGRYSLKSTAAQFDVVSSLFSLNFFWEQERDASIFFKNVAHQLKPDGHFIAVYCDARRLLKLQNVPGVVHVKYSGVNPFEFKSGGYYFRLSNTITESQPMEFLVDGRTVEKIALRHSLFPVDLTGSFGIGRDGWFEPNISHNADAISRCYRAVAFQYKPS